jgi:hypothetical protein
MAALCAATTLRQERFVSVLTVNRPCFPAFAVINTLLCSVVIYTALLLITKRQRDK